MRKYSLTIFLIFIILFCLYPNSISLAGSCDGAAVVSTTSGNHVQSSTMHQPICPCPEAEPINVSGGPTISAGSSISVNITGGCPPYTCHVSGSGGYYWENRSQTLTTKSPSVALSCAPGI